jgi:hypothetical protein
MGGYGSGSYQSDAAKDTVEGLKSLSISRLSHSGVLQGESCCGSLTWENTNTVAYKRRGQALTLQYTFISGPHKGESVEYAIQITETHPHYGGRRSWFQCPTCSRRCGKLHLANTQRYFLCRICADLTYQSTREPRLTRLLASCRAHEQRRAALAAQYANRTMKGR